MAELVWFDVAVVGLALRFLAHLLAHPRGRDTLVGQIVRDALVAPALVVVEVEDLTDDVRLGGDDLEFLRSLNMLSLSKVMDI